MDIGSNWNGWIVERFIGEGSYGKVYQISKKEFGYTYTSALKVIRIPQSKEEEKSVRDECLTEEGLRNYFLSIVAEIVNECALMSKLKGFTNIVSYEDHLVEERTDGFGWNIYIRMELLTSLRDYLQVHELTVKDLIRLGIDICKAMEVYQSYNIIHRDIKPENIFVSRFGDFELGDFGIARRLENASSALSKKGTYSYMAPEVYKSMPYDHTVDIYSLGIVMYRYLNYNRTPFMPDYPQLIKASDRTNADMRRLKGDKMPKPAHGGEQLAAIVLKACAYEPSERFQNPRDMREALEELLAADEAFMRREEERLSKNKEADIKKEKQGELFQNKSILALVIAMIIAVFGGGLFTLNMNRKTEVPSIVNLTEDQAELLLSAANLKLGDKTEIYNNTVDKGLIISQKQKAESEVKVSTAIDYTLSLGEQPVMPNLTNMTIDQATAELKKVNLEIKNINKEYSTKVAKGKIISQSPNRNQPVEKDTIVNITISLGVKQTVVPDVDNMSEDKAKEAMKKANLKVSINRKYSSSVSSGKVISQGTKAGKTVDEGTTVTLNISRGKKTVVQKKSSKKRYSKKSTRRRRSSKRSRRSSGGTTELDFG